MSESEMTDADVNALLERFDQTEPRLQRRIIAAFVCDAATLRDENESLRKSCEDLLALVADAIAHGMPVTAHVAAVRNAACAALNKADGK